GEPRQARGVSHRRAERRRVHGAGPGLGAWRSRSRRRERRVDGDLEPGRYPQGCRRAPGTVRGGRRPPGSDRPRLLRERHAERAGLPGPPAHRRPRPELRRLVGRVGTNAGASGGEVAIEPISPTVAAEELDLRGEICPYTFLKARLALEAISPGRDRKSTRLNSSHQIISYAV